MIAIHKEAQTLLKKHGLADEGWTFKISTTKRRMGACDYNSKQIEVSAYFLNSPQEELTDVLLHEIAHALVGPKNGHNYVWKAKCREIGANPSRTYETVKVVNTAQYNYVLRCPRCKREWKRYRLKRSLIGNAICPTCTDEKGEHIFLQAFKYVKSNK